MLRFFGSYEVYNMRRFHIDRPAPPRPAPPPLSPLSPSPNQLPVTWLIKESTGSEDDASRVGATPVGFQVTHTTKKNLTTSKRSGEGHLSHL